MEKWYNRNVICCCCCYCWGSTFSATRKVNPDEKYESQKRGKKWKMTCMMNPHTGKRKEEEEKEEWKGLLCNMSHDSSLIHSFSSITKILYLQRVTPVSRLVMKLSTFMSREYIELNHSARSSFMAIRYSSDDLKDLSDLLLLLEERDVKEEMEMGGEEEEGEYPDPGDTW